MSALFTKHPTLLSSPSTRLSNFTVSPCLLTPLSVELQCWDNASAKQPCRGRMRIQEKQNRTMNHLLWVTIEGVVCFFYVPFRQKGWSKEDCYSEHLMFSALIRWAQATLPVYSFLCTSSRSVLSTNIHPFAWCPLTSVSVPPGEVELECVWFV